MCQILSWHLTKRLELHHVNLSSLDAIFLSSAFFSQEKKFIWQKKSFLMENLLFFAQKKKFLVVDFSISHFDNLDMSLNLTFDIDRGKGLEIASSKGQEVGKMVFTRRLHLSIDLTFPKKKAFFALDGKEKKSFLIELVSLPVRRTATTSRIRPRRGRPRRTRIACARPPTSPGKSFSSVAAFRFVIHAT